MKDDLAQWIHAHPKYQALVSKRSSYGWMLTALMMIVYYGYILIIAFDKELLAEKLGGGVMTIGIPVGLGVILFTIVITGIYVRRANAEFDAMTSELLKEVK